MILALTALLATFVGLLAILLLYTNRYKRGHKKKSEDSHQPQQLQQQRVAKRALRQWVAERDVCLPSVAAVLRAINNSRTNQHTLLPSEESVRELRLEQLLPGTPLPVFTPVEQVSSVDTDTLSLVCDVEWPNCVPGLLVSVVRGDSDKTTTHRLQVDYMKMKAAVELSLVGGQLLVSWQLQQRPVVRLLCVSEEKEGNTVNESSSVADAVATLLTQFNLTRQSLSDNSDEQKEEEEEEESVPDNSPEVVEKLADNEAIADISPEVVAMSADNDEHHDDEVDGKVVHNIVQEKARPTDIALSYTGVSGEESVVLNDQMSSSSMDHNTHSTSDIDDAQVSTSLNNDTASPSSLPSPQDSNSRKWRRSPSYERLEEISIDTPHPTFVTPLSCSTENLTDGVPGRDRMATLSIRSYESLLEDTIGTTPSTLVFEIQDGRHIQHRVALNVEHARQFRKQYPKSKKLHIYLDHTFLAVQVRRRQHCVVCRESITILFGKHGYQCRDCGIMAHKQCHYLVDNSCTHSKVSSMNLLYPDGYYSSSSPKL